MKLQTVSILIEKEYMIMRDFFDYITYKNDRFVNVEDSICIHRFILEWTITKVD